MASGKRVRKQRARGKWLRCKFCGKKSKGFSWKYGIICPSCKKAVGYSETTHGGTTRRKGRREKKKHT